MLRESAADPLRQAASRLPRTSAVADALFVGIGLVLIYGAMLLAARLLPL